MKYFVTMVLSFIFTSILTNAQQEVKGVTTIGGSAVSETVGEIMARQILGVYKLKDIENEKELDYPDRHNLPQNPNSPDPSIEKLSIGRNQVNTVSPQTIGINFTGATYASMGANSTPPDNMGCVGPTQYIVAVNGQIVSYNKTTGLADGYINTSLDNFFTSVKTSGESTCDPRIRYDRFSHRWFVLDIDLPAVANRILIAVSTDSVITSSTSFHFFYYQTSTTFFDYPTLGVDNNALYIGGNLFSSTGAYKGTAGLVVNKNSILGTGPMVVTKFTLGTSSSGMYTPQGVNNLYDASATEGYFVGVDAVSYGLLDLYRISNPGGTPTLSSIIKITVPATSSPINIISKPGTSDNTLDPVDERLYSAMIRNGHLWTAHHIGLTNTGAVSGTLTRDGARWYDLINFQTGSTPTYNQYGTIYTSNSTNVTTDKNYSFPTITTNGQGHAAIGFSTAGTNDYINAGFAGRLVTDAANTMQAPVQTTASATPYNLTWESSPHRWGDYSMIDCDPSDDMTMWTIQEFCDGASSYACRVTQLLAPAPAALISATPNVLGSGSNQTLVIKGDTTTGLGFFDPGASFSKHLTASIDGGIIVNSVTYNSPSTITLNVTTTGGTSGDRTVTITNPDGQTVSSASIFTYNSILPVELVSFKAQIKRANEIQLNWTTATEVNSQKFDVERSSDKNSWFRLTSINAAGNSYKTVNYTFTDKSRLSQGIYYYRLKQYDMDGTFKELNTIEVNYTNIPSAFGLSQNYPNPFNPSTRISFQVPEKNNVNLSVYDILGNKVTTLVNEAKEPGQYDITFDASRLSSGVYFYKMQSGNFVVTKKMTILK